MAQVFVGLPAGLQENRQHEKDIKFGIREFNLHRVDPVMVWCEVVRGLEKIFTGEFFLEAVREVGEVADGADGAEQILRGGLSRQAHGEHYHG